MSLFQESVLKNFKHDENLLAQRWANFQKYKEKIDYLRIVKEENYQEGFLKDVFENCLGYTLKTTNPSSFNLDRESKNETDAKKADGAIYVNDKVVGVIELKAQDTKNLDKKSSKDKLSPIDQAFGYLVSNSDARYVVVSNFNELRFYIDKKTRYEEFSLFELDYDGFKKLHLLLAYESIRDDLPLTLRAKSTTFEQEISKRLYKDYALFRTELFENLLQHNPSIDKSTILRLTQKLCDRIIFILFGEDRGLLRANTIQEIRDEFQNQKFTNHNLYEIYKFYFNAINEGNEKLGIHKYNGGLFAKDTLLDDLIIDDYILDLKAQKLSDYNFESEVSVNILGHIFEQSLTDLEELQANIDNIGFDKKKTKRKKDGVFYTPEYITRYIVENTLGEMCNEKREELKLTNVIAPKNPKKLNKTETKTKENLSLYKEWLFDLKILDPACGSGAFLNQALEYLIKEHKQLQNDFAMMGDLFASYTVEESVLENNLYGVDINEDAVEIAKLSLWLRTAYKGRTLTKLAEKIKCANSLLDMPFAEKSFDIVIGNPPYVRVQGLKSNYEDESKLYEDRYESATGKYDIYALFLEMSYRMLKETGKLSYILPHKFLVSDFGRGIRGFMATNRAVESLLHFGSEMVFEDASTYTCIITLSHNNEKLMFKHIKPKDIFDTFEYDTMSYNKLNEKKWNLSNKDVSRVLDKMNKQPIKVKDIFEENTQGIVSGADKIFVLEGMLKGNLFIGYSKASGDYIEIEKDIVKPIFKAQDIRRYEPLGTHLYIVYPHYLNKSDKTVPYNEEELKASFPLAYDYLSQFKNELIAKKIKYKTNRVYWYSLHRSREYGLMMKDKLVVPYLSLLSQFNYDDNKNFFSDASYVLTKYESVAEDYKFYLTLLNSSLMWFFIKNISAEFGGGFYYYKTQYTEKYPLPKLDNLEDQEPFIEKADLMFKIHKKLEEIKEGFFNELELEKVSKKLKNFEELEFEEFVKEYKKAKKLKFTNKLEERNFKNEWKSLFENDKKEALEIQNQIRQTDREIDAMVYELYGLTDDEIKIVEDS